MKFVILAAVVALIVFYFAKNSGNKKAAVENIAIGNDFLAQNKANVDVLTTASGLQYQVLNKGTGTTHQTASSTVKVH